MYCNLIQSMCPNNDGNYTGHSFFVSHSGKIPEHFQNELDDNMFSGSI